MGKIALGLLFKTRSGCCHTSRVGSVISGQGGFKNPACAEGSAALEA